MKKCEERDVHDSCWNRCDSHEEVFIICERDPVAADVILHWIQLRLSSGINSVDDEKIQSALLSYQRMKSGYMSSI